MSRRFGRNQRRRAREAIAAAQDRIDDLQGALKLDRAMLEHYRGKIKRAEDFQREVAAIVGRESIIAGEPMSMDLKRETFSRADGWKVIPKRPFPRLDEMAARSMEMEPLRHEVLRLLDIELVADKFRGQMQAWVHLAGAEVAYGLTEEVFRRLSDQELMRHLVEPVARQLAIELKRRFR